MQLIAQMPTAADLQADAEIRQAENKRKSAKRNSVRTLSRKDHVVKFIGVDGEGVGKGDDHKYVLLAVGDRLYENPDGIEWWEAFEFLYFEGFQVNPDAAFVGFYLGYDFIQILKGISYNRAMMLLDDGEIKAHRTRKESGKNPTPFPVEIAPPANDRNITQWQFDMLKPLRRLKLRPKYCECQRTDCVHVNGCHHLKGWIRPEGHECKQGTPWMYVCDAGPFFQTSLLNAINPKKWPDGQQIVSPEEYAILEQGKERRATHELDDEMRAYTRLENEVLARLMHEVNRGLTAIDVRLTKDSWYGPGQAAQMWMRNQPSIPRRIELTLPSWVRTLAEATYMGGWFEIFAHGILPGITYEYDINSAYPFIMASLPCLMHGNWTRGTGKPGPLTPGRYRMVSTEVWGRDMQIGAMLHRDKDGWISRPSHTRGCYWQHEIDAAVRAKIVDQIDYIEWAEYEPCNCPPPVRGMAELYQKRLEASKDSPLGKGAKTVYNSGYGKFAQSIGHPLFANPVYASLITAGCRTMILDAIATHPEGTRSVTMVATDAVYFRKPHPGLERTVSEKLGDWSGGKCTPEKCAGKHNCGEKRNLTQFKPGVYWDDATRERLADDPGSTPAIKSRGVNAKALARNINAIDGQFRTWIPNAPNPFPVVKFAVDFSIITLQQALQGKDGKSWHKAGQIIEQRELKQDSNPSTKRHPWLRYEKSRKMYRSQPYNEPDDLDSKPYPKHFGYDEMDAQDRAAGMTPDGPGLMLLREGLGIG